MKENTAAIHVQVPVDVATYLLNEKRNEIHIVEQRLKINCLLIPNIHLQTPNYTITRLRHDELNQNDVTAPSYTLTEIPLEQAEVQLPGQKAEVVKTQAAVQGVTPAQPAPARAMQSLDREASWLTRLFRWLFGGGETTTEKRKRADTRSRRGSHASREERAGRRRGGRDGQEMRERRRRRGKATGEAGTTPQAGEARESQRERTRQRQQPAEAGKPSRREQQRQAAKARAERAESAAIEQRSPSSVPEAVDTESRSGETRSGRRRRRRGRGGERRQEAQAGVTATQQQQVQPAPADSDQQQPERPQETIATEQQPTPASFATEPGESQEEVPATVDESTEQTAISAPDNIPPETVAAAETEPGSTSPELIAPEQIQTPLAEEPETPGEPEPHYAQPEPVDIALTNRQQPQADQEAEQALESDAASASQPAVGVQQPQGADIVSAEEPIAPVSETQWQPTSEQEELVAQESDTFEEHASAPETVASESATGADAWRMEPVDLPPEMELVETRPGAVTEVEDAYLEEPQPAKRSRRSRPESDQPVPDEPLIQIETGASEPVNNVDNR